MCLLLMQKYGDRMAQLVYTCITFIVAELLDMAKAILNNPYDIAWHQGYRCFVPGPLKSNKGFQKTPISS